MGFVVPSIDIMQGKAVRLRQGRRGSEEVLGEPVLLARKYQRLGFPYLHVVDLDAVFGNRDSLEILADISAACPNAKIQWAGGIRSAAQAEKALGNGAARVVLGSMIFSNPAKAKRCAQEFGAGKVWASLDFGGSPPTARVLGWGRETGFGVSEAVAAAEWCGVGGVVISSIDSDGMGTGPDIALLENAAAQTNMPIWLAGGMRSTSDAVLAFGKGAVGAIFGRALYGDIDLEGLTCLQKG